MRRQYMVGIIRGAHDKRYKAAEGDGKKDVIQLTEAWVEELKKHPYYSRNLFLLKHYREIRQEDISLERERKGSKGAQGQGTSPPY